MSPSNIHAITRSDHAAIADLLVRAYALVIARLPPADGREFADGLPGAVEQYAENGTWLVADEGSTFAGCVAYFGPYSTELPAYQGNCAHVQLLGVDPAYSRRGIGRALMEWCIARAVEEAAEEVRLKTSEYLPEARRLYESMGFAVREVLPSLWGKPAYLYARRAA